MKMGTKLQNYKTTKIAKDKCITSNSTTVFLLISSIPFIVAQFSVDVILAFMS